MRLSVRLSSSLTPERLRAGVRSARDAGMRRVWLADNPLERSSPVSAAALAAEVPELEIGLGVLSVRERNPVVLAQEMVALQSYHQGRVLVGLGVGTDVDRRKLGLPRRSGLGLLRQTTEVVRALSRGEAVPALDGELDEPVELKLDTRPLPVYIGAVGPKTLALSGEIADGVILSLGTTVEAARTAIASARAAREAAGGGNGFDAVAYVAFGGLDGTERDPALEAFVVHLLRSIPDQPAIARLLEGTGYDADGAARLVEAHDRGRPVPPELIAATTIRGPLDAALERLEAYRAAGVDELAFGLGGWNEDLDGTLAGLQRLATAWSDRR